MATWIPLGGFVPWEGREKLAVTVTTGSECVDGTSILTLEIELSCLDATAAGIAGARERDGGLLSGDGHTDIVVVFVGEQSI